MLIQNANDGSSWAAGCGLLLLPVTAEEPSESMMGAVRCFSSMSGFRTCLSLHRMKLVLWHDWRS